MRDVHCRLGQKNLNFSCYSEFFDIVIKPDTTCQLKKLNSLPNTSCRYTTSGDGSHFFRLFDKKGFFSQLGETKILLESPSSNLRETRNPKLDTGPRDSGTGLVMIKER